MNNIITQLLSKDLLPARTDHDSWINPLTDEELSIIYNGLANCEHNWAPHSTDGVAGLSYKNPGKTIWLHDKWPSSPWIYREGSSSNQIIDLLKTLSIKYNLGNNHGRSYIHRLLPGNDVSPHKDVNDWYYFQMINRYHLYIDIPLGASVAMGGPFAPNSILLFRHDIIHSYVNNSKTPMIFVVFDIFR